MAIILSLVIGCTLLIWGVSTDWVTLLGGGFWSLRGEFVLVSGLILFVVMSVIMFLSTRPKWLEQRMDGLDKMYRVHKWLGISCILWLACHYLSEKLPKWNWVRAIVDFPPRVKKGTDDVFIPSELIGFAKGIGEYAIWIFGFLVLVALLQRIPYHKFRWIHKIFPVLFLFLIAHALTLMPEQWWFSIVGIWAIFWAIIGGGAAFLSLTGHIGEKRKYKGKIAAILAFPENDLVQVDVRLNENQVMSYRAGQFAFLTFSVLEGAHPFTIVSYDGQSRMIRFAIKGLGDCTNHLVEQLKVDQNALIEGAYGCLDFADENPQIWVAGGIGITPFLARMDALIKQGGRKENIYFFCSFKFYQDLYPLDLKQRCVEAGVVLHLAFSHEEGGERWSAQKIQAACPNVVQRASVWFCGPDRFGKAIRENLQSVSFHGELFRFR